MVPRQLSTLEKLIGPRGLTKEQKVLYRLCKDSMRKAADMAKTGKPYTLKLIAWVAEYMPVDLTQKLDKIERTYNEYRNT